MMSLDARSMQCFNRSGICSGGLIDSLETRLRLFTCMLYSCTAGILQLCSGQWDPFMHKAKLMLKRLQKCTLMRNLPSDSAPPFIFFLRSDACAIKCSENLGLPLNSTGASQ